MSDVELTPAQERVLRACCELVDEHRSASYGEIAARAGLQSKTTARHHLLRLAVAGLVVVPPPRQPRGTHVTQRGRLALAAAAAAAVIQGAGS